MTGHETSELSSFFKPKAMAVIGASNDLEKPGGRLMDYARRHSRGIDVYPVNPGRSEVMGKRAYHSIVDIPSKIDVACLAIPKSGILQSLKDCGTKGVKFAIVFASGYAELGNSREELDLVREAKAGGTRLLGPNCQGVVSPASGYVASYHSCLEGNPVRGKVGLLTQSGALGGYLCGALWERGVGTSHFVSVGNGSDLGIEELLEYLAGDAETGVVVTFLEGVRNGRAFMDAADSVRKAGKPLLVLKTGRSERGKASALTHTGSMAGSDAVYDAVFRQVGAVRVSQLDELVGAANALAWQPLPRGGRVAFLSPSGAACALVADLCEDVGLEVADLSQETLDRMKELLPQVAVAKNPLDLVYVYGNPNARTLVGDLIEVMANDDSVDMVIPGLTISTALGLEIMEHTFRKTEKVTSTLKKPVIWWWATSSDAFRELRRVFADRSTPIYPSPEQAVRVGSVMARCADSIRQGAE